MAPEATVSLKDQILCTCVGASVTSVCTTPLDVIKVRLQAQQKSSRSLPNKWSPVICNCSRLFSNSFCLRHEHTTSHAYKIGTSVRRNCAPFASSSMGVVASLLRNEGLRSLWSGLSPTLLMSVPGTMIYFTAYDQLKQRMGYSEANEKKLIIPVVAGALSRGAAVVVVSPLELLRTKMQSTRVTYLQLFGAIRTSVRLNGLSFLFRGLGPSLLRDVPFSAIYWLSYESMKTYYKPHSDLNTSGFFVYFASGAFSGLVAALLTCPFDVVKTQRQIELGELTPSRSTTSTWSLLKSLYRSKGFPGLYAGIVPRMIKVAPSCAIMISTYEVGKKVVCEWNAKNAECH